MKLRPYQEDAVQSLYDYFAEESGNPLLVLPTASGKSLIQADFIRRVVANPGQRVLCLSHVKELLQQNAEKLWAMIPFVDLGIYSAGLKRRDLHNQVIVAGIQSIHKRAHELGSINLVIVDECFEAGTMVLTPYGQVDIASLRPGDIVLNAYGAGAVRAVSKTTSLDIYELEFSDGKKTRCTGGHPFFTRSGWVEARSLVRGACAFGVEGLQALRKTVHPAEIGGLNDVGRRMGQAAVLLAILREEAEEPNALGEFQEEDAEHPYCDRPPPENQRRERDGHDSPARKTAVCDGGRVGCGVDDKDRSPQGARMPDALQRRSSEQGEDGRHRGRRGEPLQPKEAGARRQEGFSPLGPWLVSSSRVECKSPRVVYNIQVSGHPSYFANGKLVHNCHLISPKGSGMYRSFLADLKKINPRVKVIGMTATPFRMGTGLLHEGKGAIFTDIAYNCDMKQLISDGYLSPLVSKTGKVRPDVSGVAVRGGEFVAGELARAVNDAEIITQAVQEIIDLGYDRKKMILFCAGVAHAIAVRDEMRDQGVVTECVTGETPTAERDDILRRFKAGEIRAITNMNVLSVGFDAPGIDLVAMLRPTKSAGLYVQQVGRGMRLAEAKKDCLVLDYAGNILEHGPIDMIRIRSKAEGGGVETAPMKECPKCRAALLISLMACPNCGYEYPVEEKPKHAPKADRRDIISSEESNQEFDVIETRYTRHSKPGKPDSMRVIYQVGLAQHFSEWICFEHGGFAAKKARNWWSAATSMTLTEVLDIDELKKAMPTSTEEALSRTCNLRDVATVKVNTAGKYPEIISREFMPF